MKKRTARGVAVSAGLTVCLLAALPAFAEGAANSPLASPSVPTALSNYITNGLIAFWDGTYNSTNETGELCHDSSATVWLDLSGSGHDARVATTIPPYWGDNYFNTSNSVNGKSSRQCRMDFTPSEEFLSAINDVHFTYQACFKVRTWMNNTAFFGCNGSGGTWGMRTYTDGNVYFSICGKETASMGIFINEWMAGCVHSIAAEDKTFNVVVDTTAHNANLGLTPGSSPTLGNGRIGGACTLFTGDCDYELYAGRVYNRALTGVEMAYNAALDRIRYFGDAPRTTVNVSSYSSTHVNYGTATTAYDKLTATTVGAEQTFSIAGVAAHPFDGESAVVLSGGRSRALYLGAAVTTIAADGSETTVDYPKTVTSVEAQVAGDMFATWKWRLQHQYMATAAKGGTLRVGDSTEPVGAYTNWYTAADAVQVTVTAVPDEGFAFSAWEGDFAGEASSPTMTVTLSAAKTLTATFVRGGKGDGSTYTWKGGSSSSWFDGNNWDRGFPPLEGDRVVISPKANATILVNAATPPLLSFVLGGSNGTATVQFQNWDTVLTADEVTIKNKGVLQPVSAFTDTQSSNRVAVVCNNFTLETGASINASGLGWVAPKLNTNGSGPGAGQQNRGGAGYGGWGACGYKVRNANFGNPYGSLTAPTDPGSGGGQSGTSGGGAGGGAVLIQASNNIRIDGSIRADGADSASTWGSGSGGGVYLSCRTFEGTGTITARGGATTGDTNGGAGGGRIAIVYDVEAQAAVSPKPTPILHAGARRYGAQYGCYPPADRVPTLRNSEHQCGTPGTVYLADDSFYPGDIWSKCSGLFHFGTETGGAFELDDPSFADEASVSSANLAQDVWFHDREVRFPNGLTLPKYVHVVFTNCTVYAKSLLVSSGCFDLRGHSTLVVEGDAVAEGTGRFNFEAGPTNGVEAATWNPWGQTVKVCGKLWLKDTSVLYPVSHSVNGGSVNFELGRLEVASGASVNGVSCGFGYYTELTLGGSTSWGPGASGAANVGPAHGGFGGGAGKQNQHVYGDEKHPTLPGTDGGRWGSTAAYVGGWGGGLFHATVAKSAVVDGTINMNGRGSYGVQGCGSSGGGVYLSCCTLKGSGSITANGAGGTSSTGYSGSGGGGRIAVYSFDTNSWYGTMTAAAGTNDYKYTSYATAGTVYVKVPRGLMLFVR